MILALLGLLAVSLDAPTLRHGEAGPLRFV